MLRPKREEPDSLSLFRKVVRIFTLTMTLVYVALGIFIMFAADRLRLSISSEMRYAIGGILVLYGVVRFIRAYQRNKRVKEENNNYEE